MTFVSYAQNFEDVLLWRAFRDVSRGFYIDVGAAHPDTDSVTRAFYDRGWRGINIEPVPEYAVRLSAARPRDINLRVALGAEPSDGTVYVIAGTGLSSMDAELAERYRGDGLEVQAEDVPVRTLADICRDHAPAELHFLKIDVEGAEKAVLDGADFTQFRPRIVLVEATEPGSTVQTHQDWEPVLLAAGYGFVWFDGLNRFYVAQEHMGELGRHFETPVCVFDDFLRAADTEWTRRITAAEMQAADLLERSMAADAGIAVAERRAEHAEERARSIEQWARKSDEHARGAEATARDAQERARSLEGWALASDKRANDAEERLRQAEAQIAVESQRLQAWLKRAQDEEAAMRASTSWRLTAPLRRAAVTARVLAGRPAGEARAPAFPPPSPALPAAPAGAAGRAPSEAPAFRHGGGGRAQTADAAVRAVHQFHSGSAVGDAITNAMLLIRGQLRGMGYRSDIYVEHRDPLLQGELRLLDELPDHAGYVLILHHSMGFDAYRQVMAYAAPKVLMYHNITPPELFAGQPDVQRYIRLGREQLAGMRGHVSSALADSEFNAIELRRLGFADASACTLLFDLDALRGRAPAMPRDPARPFTILFVGRIVPSKGQLDLVEAYARFRARDARPSRLVLVGRGDHAGQAYADTVRARVRELDLDSCVTLAGLVGDDELKARYAEADLYVSLSRHEGFGVPLVEAAACGVPVLAWPAGAVAYTLGVQDGLLRSRDPDEVAVRMAELAVDPGARAALARAQSEAVARFALPRQMAALDRALARAGAAPPRDPAVAGLLAANLRFTVAGHVNKTYSLAAINRTLARVLETARPGHVRLIPVEGEPTGDLRDVPEAERATIAALAARPPSETGPVVVISQHYPVYVPEDQGDALLAYVFWEESLLPAQTVAVLNGRFRAVLAPSSFVAKALVDSGVSVAVHVVGFAPELAAFQALPDRTAVREQDFTFLHVSSAFPRKGLDVLLAAYAQAFRAGDPVRLVVKTFPNPHNDAARQIDALRADPQAPRIELIDRDLDADGMAGLFRAAGAMVLPTRGEGFNLPAAEAMAAGIPLIVTGYGGHMDFCDAATARLLEYRLAPSGSHLATPMSLWAEPDRDDLTAALREVFADRLGAALRAHAAKEAVSRLLAPARFVRKVEEAAVTALRFPAPQRLRLCVISSWGVRCGVADYTRQLVDGMRAADAGLDVTVLSDSRPQEVAPAGEAVRARQVWSLGAADNAESLQMAVAAADPDAVMIQHQPGLLDWATLGRTLEAISAPHRVTSVTLHNTSHLLEVGETVRQAGLAGLRLASRVAVHTLADLERLRGLGLGSGAADTLVLMPQGAPSSLAARPERVLAGADAVTIGCCGFLLPDKGIPALIEAAGILRARWPLLRLRLLNAEYGNTASKEEAELARRTIRSCGLDNSVELVTDYLPYEEARGRLAECDVVVLPYQRSKEASSAALRMALSSGPCVAVTPIGLFDDGENAVYRLPGTQPAAIAEGLTALLADAGLRRSVQSAAQAWLAGRGWQAVAARTAGMMRGLAASLAV